jgi:hypothetical protein
MTSIIVKANFSGYHYWAEAPEEVSFLRNEHRHIFYVELKIEVLGDNRELEFFIVKRQLVGFLNAYKEKTFTESCEMIGGYLKNCFEKIYPDRKISVSVLEDNENGSICE